MEHISEALTKARASLSRNMVGDAPRERNSARAARRLMLNTSATLPLWTPPPVALEAKVLERQRIVSFETRDPSHIAFNVLRTRVRKAMQENGWQTLLVTSPTAGCGKTMVALNLAFSLARIPDCRTAVVDLDLARPAIARTLGIHAAASITDHLTGNSLAPDCFVQVTKNLFVGLNDRPAEFSSETLQGSKLSDLISSISSGLAPGIIIIDAPPMAPGDDVLAMLPQVDAVLLVAASGMTTVAEVDECEQQISGQEKLLGIVLNKCPTSSDRYYY